MTDVDVLAQRAEPVPLPENITSVQPGGGLCYRVECAWGRWRRWCLKTFRPGYVRRMADCRQGADDGAPHEILDSRDLKYIRNQCSCDWDEADDRFTWRDKIPLARWGLGETVIMGVPLLVLGIVPAVIWPGVWYVAIVPLVLFAWVLYFFRDPRRSVPAGAGILVAPADGKVAEVTRLPHHDFVGGPAVRIGIFLSIFNVHINRAPCRCRVIELRYIPGLFLNALDPASAEKNENMWIGMEEESPPYRRLVVRQIAGLIARRIVCNLRSGESLRAGQQFGMIKLGSRTELVLPDEDGLTVEVSKGQKVKAGSTVLARYGTEQQR